jgi:hypothetical protein
MILRSLSSNRRKYFAFDAESSTMTRLLVLWPNLILIGAVLSLATVFVGNWTSGYGFPLAWKTGGCPAPGIEISASCLLAIGYDWLNFGLDVLFYTFAGYGPVLVYAKYRARRRVRSESGSLLD